jgi:hypothetical protein
MRAALRCLHRDATRAAASRTRRLRSLRDAYKAYVRGMRALCSTIRALSTDSDSRVVAVTAAAARRPIPRCPPPPRQTVSRRQQPRLGYLGS